MTTEAISTTEQTPSGGNALGGAYFERDMKEHAQRVLAEQRTRNRLDLFATILSQRANLSPDQAADAADTVYKKLCTD